MGTLFEYKNRRISYSDQGRGEVVILLHGYLETSESWNGFATRLAEKFRVIAVDLPGHGESDIFSETHTVEFMAGIVNDLTRYLGISKFFLTGHSLGGYITLAFLELFPESLSGYSLFHSHPFADTPEIIRKREREINLIRAGKKDLIWPENIKRMFAPSGLEKFTNEIQRSGSIASAIPGEAIIGVLKGMIARPSRLQLMEAGEIPCLWILGSMDNYINCDEVRARIKLPPNAKVVILKNSGHLGFIEEEELSLEILTDFILQNT